MVVAQKPSDERVSKRRERSTARCKENEDRQGKRPVDLATKWSTVNLTKAIAQSSQGGNLMRPASREKRRKKQEVVICCEGTRAIDI